MGFAFWKNFGAAKGAEIGKSITTMLVKMDPKTASEAEIATRTEEFEKLSIQAETARAEYNKEKSEADAAKANFDKMMAAAGVLENKMKAAQEAGNSAEATKQETALNKLMDQIGQLEPEVQSAQQDAADGKNFLDQLEAALAGRAKELKEARSMLANAQRDMKRAEIEAQRAKDQEARAKDLAGITSGASSSMGTALDAMKTEADKKRIEAEAAKKRATLLGQGSEEDDAIKAAMAEVTPGNTSGMSASERLAAMRAKQG